MDVNEKGVEATGATGAAVTLYSFFPAQVEVVLNRPFLAFIVDRKRNTIMFAGKVADPTE
jgi:serine protease inhibitor